MNLMRIFIGLMALVLGCGASAVSSHSKQIAESCLKKGIKLEARAERDPENATRFFKEALDHYLCGSKNGNPMASYRAAILSESGQAPALKKEVIKSLLLCAAEAGIPDGQAALADFFCDSDIPPHCKDVETASKWFERASKRGSGDAANVLGSFYERGQRGPVDLNRAQACYAIGVKRGLKIAQYNFNRVTKMLHGDAVKPAKCY